MTDASLASKAIFCAGVGAVAVGRLVESRRQSDPGLPEGHHGE